MSKTTWNLRGLTSLFTLAGFLVMSITGLVLYVVPAGRVAYWVDWHFLRLSKTNWGDIHILSSILFVVAGGFHIYFNWKPLMKYLRNKVTGGIKLKKELALSTAGLLLVWVSAVYKIPPLSYLLDLNAAIKDAWITSKDYEPPFGHAELVSLQSFCKKTDISTDRALAELEAAGLTGVDPERTLGEIAADNGTTPLAIYRLIRKHERSTKIELPDKLTAQGIEELFADTGVGNKSLSDIAKRLDLPSGELVARLARKQIEVDPDATLKSAGSKHGLAPLELLKAALVEDYVPNE